MNKKINTIILLIVMAILISSIVYSNIELKVGKQTEIFNLNNCTGEVLVKVEEKHTFGNYDLIGCNAKENNFWSCGCKENFTVFFYSLLDSENEYDFIFEYYIGDLNDINNKRTKQVNDLKLIKEKVKEPVVFPSLNDTKTLFIIIGIVALIIITILFFIFKYIFNSDDIDKYTVNKTTVDKKRKDKKLTDEEIDKILKNI